MKHVEAALAQGNIKLVDNRSEAEYRGEERKEGASYAGRIEGSLHLDYYQLIDTRPEAHQRLKSLAELETIFAEAGLQPADTIINYCHSGVRSALVTFVMTQLLDYPHVQNYDGSWTEWSLYHPQWSKPL
jgi:thiosulfate/3-mercaptopyruvate sulfurtransferase